MYTKLALRNAKRSIFNYLLYITTMTILIAIMYISNSIAIFGNKQAGFQTASLPLFIVMIMVALVNYINSFMMRQRAKEFATYLLLGMEKNKLLQMFLLEFSGIGILCFIFGILIGAFAYHIVLYKELHGDAIQLTLTIQSIIQTFFFFCIVEILSAVRIRKKIYKLQIFELMNENRRNQAMDKNNFKFWEIGFCISFLIFMFLLCAIAFFPANFVSIIISFISIPLLSCIYTFYKWMYAYFVFKRLSQSNDLYQDDRLYCIAEMTTGAKTSALMSSIFCTCLLFGVQSFVFGTLLYNSELNILNHVNQQWMGFFQISISIIFIAIFFSILSLQQIIDIKRQSKNILMLYYMGKSQSQIKSLIKMQIMLKLVFPTFMCFVLLLVGTPFINYKINRILPDAMNHSFIKAVGGFIVWFIIIYSCYFEVVYITSIRYIKTVIKF